VTKNKLLWTPSVLDFFNIPKKDRRAYETEREKASQKRKVEQDKQIAAAGIGGRNMNSDLRRGSYTDLASCLREDDDVPSDVEEDNPGETGSADQQKRPAPV
jgi:hypothetical protein